MFTRRPQTKLVLTASAIALAAVSHARADQANPDSVKVWRDAGATTFSVLDNDDAGSPGSKYAIFAVTPPSHGTLTIAPGGTGVVYTPTPGYVGGDDFVYTVTNAFRRYDVPRMTLATVTGTPIFDGFGSALAPVPGKSDEWYVMTDRGPNVDGPAGGKVFALTGFTPQIGRYKLADGVLTLQQTILFKDSQGHLRSGLPNPIGAGGTGEVAYDNNGNLLAADPSGLDSEGLVALADGTFWVSDEYGPHLVHFASDGTTIEQIEPFAVNALGHKLPTCLKFRIINKGMEGLTLTPDGKTLVGLMQSPLANQISESDAGKSSPLRIVTIDIATGATHQYLYLVDDPKFTCSEITAVSNTDFLVDERDGKFPGSSDPSIQKRVYRVSLVGATDVSDPADGVNGKLFGGQSIELLTTKQNSATCRATLLANGITPVGKTLVFDILGESAAIGMLGSLYPHDKVEGMALVDGGRTLVMSNDDDFGVNAGATTFSVVPKAIPTLPGTPTDFTQLLFVDLPNLPAHARTAPVHVTVEGPHGVLSDLLASLSTFDATDKHDDHHVSEAATHLGRALIPDPFADEMHIAGGTPDKGERLFHELHDAVDQLELLMNGKKSSVDDATIQKWIASALWSARLLAATAISDASADAKGLAKAKGELATGDSCAASSRFAEAVDHYGLAVKALQ
jgi:hypothetical protein